MDRRETAAATAQEHGRGGRRREGVKGRGRTIDSTQKGGRGRKVIRER